MSNIRYDRRAFAPISDKEIRTTLRKVAREVSVPIFKRNFAQGQAGWQNNSPAYARRKGYKAKFVNSGQAKKAIESEKHRYKKVRVSKRRNIFKASVALRKMQDGHNVYALAQVGKTTSPSDDMMISNTQQADEAIVAPALEEAFVALLRAKGLIR